MKSLKREAIKILMENPLYFRWKTAIRWGQVKHMMRLLKNPRL